MVCNLVCRVLMLYYTIPNLSLWTLCPRGGVTSHAEDCLNQNPDMTSY